MTTIHSPRRILMPALIALAVLIGSFALGLLFTTGCVPAPDPGDTQGELPVEVWTW